MALLFNRDKSVISRHISNIFNEKELNRKSVVAKYATTVADGKRYQTKFYNLDAIISVDYRVNMGLANLVASFVQQAIPLLDQSKIGLVQNYDPRGEKLLSE